jgi:hypothetical protein
MYLLSTAITATSLATQKRRAIPCVMPRFSFGELLVPDGWNVQLQLELRAPAARLQTAAPTVHGMQATKPAPAANIVVRRNENTASPASCADTLVNELRTSGARALHAEQPVNVMFEDGALGVAVDVVFQAGSANAAPIAQRHVFRSDIGVITHLCATAPDARTLGPLNTLLLSFSP